ncbi:hypothetical protein AEAC466_07835 [Asticcacaulis sp. AC466]|uniref:hypothetical protein n=1 Tax=Asticcacaulis sp. AC466 TaxID=1282362 RepID=UPI0003C3ED83|nr:hypothetical protein [Asticcacaulis sp. AC466]ESQ84958.1 hypothetical protein AEAC466_07835 [Asticcacaulis sp. AC466]
MRIALTLSILALVAAPAAIMSQANAAATAANTKMTQCAAQWQKDKAANKTNGQDYKTYSAACMKGAIPAAKPAMAAAKPAAVVAKPAAVVKASNTKPQDRMKECGAKWNQMKAAGKPGNQTYKQFSTTCLKS